MPGTTRYSATFDRTYEEDAKPSSPPNARRSRSQSWQANSGHDGRLYTPFAGRAPAPRSSSTDNSPNSSTEFIPTRTAKTSVKAHNNPFQFVKVGTCPLYKKAEEQLKKAKEVKKPDVLKEEEEEWQTNLDSWKSRRRKMSEDVFRRQEELKLLELEDQIAQVSQKKTKTFSEMVESRATRGRALSLCLLTSPLEFQNWEFENKTHKNGSCSFTDESGENSTVNSEDEGVSVRGRLGESSHNENEVNHRTNGDAHIEQNGSKLDTQNGNCNKLSNNVQMKPKENSYIDSGLESISSSHRAGDTPDSGSDFSQDSNSSIDCDSPRTGVNVLEEFSSKSSQISEGHEITVRLNLGEKGQDFGFTFLGGKDEGQVIIASILEGSKAESSGIHLSDRIITIDGCDVSSKKHIEIAALIQKGREKGQINLLLWRHIKSTGGANGYNAEEKHNKVITDKNLNAKSYEKSIESENEMYVDDFEELKRQSELLTNRKTDITACTNTQGVYALNVDSNQISQDGVSTGSLFPLSPVTELPSPADETKTISSTLSFSNTLPVSNSQSRISGEGKQSDVKIKPGIPIIQENNTIYISSKTETADASFLSSKNKDSQDEISKPTSTPKKVKTSKLKKVIASENIPATSESMKDLSSPAQCADVTSKAVVDEKPSSDSKLSLTLKIKQSDNKKDAENLTVTKSMENSTTSFENISVMLPTEVVTAPVKTPASNSVVSNDTGIQTSKVATNSIEVPTTNKQMKSFASEDNKPKKKKVIAKPKGNVTEKISGISTDTTLNEIYSTNSSSIIEKKERMGPKPETTFCPPKEENSVPLNGIANKSQEIKPSPAKDETSIPCPSTNKVRDLALRFGIKNSSLNSECPSTNAKSLKSPLNEKSKPVNVTKMESVKTKESCVEQNLTNSPPVASASSISNKLDSSTKNIVFPIQDKQVKTGIKEEITVSSPKRQVDIKTPISSIANASHSSSTVNIKENKPKKELKSLPLMPEKQSKLSSVNKAVVLPAEKENSVRQIPLITPQINKEIPMSPVASASDISIKSAYKENKTKKEKMTSDVSPAKQPEITTKNQIVSASPKRGNSGDQVPIDIQQVANKSFTSSVPNASDSTSSKSLIKGLQVKKEKKTACVSQTDQAKTVVKNETKVSPLTRVINFYKCHK